MAQGGHYRYFLILSEIAERLPERATAECSSEPAGGKPQGGGPKDKSLEHESGLYLFGDILSGGHHKKLPRTGYEPVCTELPSGLGIVDNAYVRHRHIIEKPRQTLDFILKGDECGFIETQPVIGAAGMSLCYYFYDVHHGCP